MDTISSIKRKMNENGTTTYQLSKRTGIKYELLRRSLHNKRREGGVRGGAKAPLVLAFEENLVPLRNSQN